MRRLREERATVMLQGLTGAGAGAGLREDAADLGGARHPAGLARLYEGAVLLKTMHVAVHQSTFYGAFSMPSTRRVPDSLVDLAQARAAAQMHGRARWRRLLVQGMQQRRHRAATMLQTPAR